MEACGKRFNYYLGPVQNVLSKAVETNGAFDLILDVWGSYKYSQDKLGLLKQYHHALKPGGQAHIYLVDDLFINDEAGKSIAFSEWASEKYPETFAITTTAKSNYETFTLTITKSTARLTLPDFVVKSSKEVGSLHGCGYSLDELKKGNAIMFDKVHVAASEVQPRELRPLAFSKKL